jgi:hypothetical protein
MTFGILRVPQSVHLLLKMLDSGEQDAEDSGGILDAHVAWVMNEMLDRVICTETPGT